MTTYSQLVMDLKSYCERGQNPSDSTFLNSINTFIWNAEDRIAKDLMIERQTRVAEITIPTNTSVMQKPADFIDNKSFIVTVGGTNRDLRIRTPEYIRLVYPDAAVGSPRYYGNYDGSHWILGPKTDQEYQAVVSYHAKPQRLSDENQTNWCTEYSYNLLMKAALLEAAIFLKDNEAMARFQGDYTSLAPSEVARDGLSRIDSNIRTPKK